MDKNLEHGGLFLQVIPSDKPEEKARIQIKKVFESLKTGKKKEQAFYIYPWELNAVTDIMVEIVETNKLNEP